MKLNKPFWVWSADGTVLYVKIARETRFLKRIKLVTIAYFFPSDWESPEHCRKSAENFINRISNEQK